MTPPRTVLITGDSSGIGAAFRDHLLASGHTVIGIARRQRSHIEHPGYHPICADLEELEKIRLVLKQAQKTFPAIDTLILNAGQPLFGHLEQLSPAAIQRSININLTSHLLVAHELLPRLRTLERADIIIMGSESGQRGGKQGTAYSAAKFGLRGFAESLRAECATSHVRVTLLQPGMVRTEFFEHVDFEPGPEPVNAIEPADLLPVLDLVMSARRGIVFGEITISPQKRVIHFKKRDVDRR